MNKSPHWSHRLRLIINVDPGSRFASTFVSVHSKLKNTSSGIYLIGETRSSTSSHGGGCANRLIIIVEA